MLKLALQNKLPEDIVWRRKFGMSVPITDWVLGPLAPLMEELLGPAALRKRGMFREDYVARLRQGQDQADETRRRRIGEKLWALAMLEAWMRVFVDGGGPPAGRCGMICIRCQHDSKYPERKDTKSCPNCGGKFAFEPREKDPFSDMAFQKAIDSVSASGQVKWGVEHLYYELRRKRKSSVTRCLRGPLLAGRSVWARRSSGRSRW